MQHVFHPTAMHHKGAQLLGVWLVGAPDFLRGTREKSVVSERGIYRDTRDSSQFKDSMGTTDHVTWRSRQQILLQASASLPTVR